MKKCKMCGSFVSDNATNCPKCGVEMNEGNVTNEEVSSNEVKFCPNCGARLNLNVNFCSNCGKSLNNEEVYPEVVDYASNDVFTMEMKELTEVYGKKATTNLTLAIVSIVLCCCSIPAVISLILSILSLKDLGKLSDNVKNTTEYRSIKNKNIIALVLAGFATFMWIVSLISQIINPVNYDDLYNSIMQDMENAGV